jgi:hypothetical protein
VCALTTSLSPFAVAVALPDAVAPVVTVPADATIEALGPTGAPYTYTASANDDVNGVVVANCSPASGETFALGATPVQCTATDAAGNTGTSSFTVTVSDTTPPVVTVPASVTIEAIGAAGAAYGYAASAADAVSGAVTPTCVPASATTFPIGSTTVQCTASDAAGNPGVSSFVVTVRDTTPPVVTVPADVTIEATGTTGAAYTYSASAVDTVGGLLTPACVPASATKFPIGSTSVTCTATDAAGNAGSASFIVTVKAKASANVAPVAAPDRYKTNADDKVAGVLRATDANGDPLTFSVVANGSKGRVVVNAQTGAFTYTPNRRADGTDEFTFRVSDGKLWSNSAVVTIRIKGGSGNGRDAGDEDNEDAGDDKNRR